MLIYRYSSYLHGGQGSVQYLTLVLNPDGVRNYQKLSNAVQYPLCLVLEMQISKLVLILKSYDLVQSTKPAFHMHLPAQKSLLMEWNHGNDFQKK